MLMRWIIPVVAMTVLVLQAGQGADPESPPLFEGLGKHSRKVTDNAEAQKFFDQGLNFLFAFNHDECRRAFAHATQLAPDCAMAHWGVAISYGSHINLPVVRPEQDKQALAAIQRAGQNKAAARPEDQALIESLAVRFVENAPEDRAALNAAYSKAMKAAWEKFPQDADIGALYVESLMNLRPWDLWTTDGKPQPETPAILSTLETVLKLNPDHPLALHLTIHALEASPQPHKAIEAADRLRHLQPGLGHMVHMPSHIDIRTGRWQKAIEANERAIATDTAYRKLSPKQDFYRLYMAHNYHMLTFAAMMCGQSARALKSVRDMAAGVPPEWVAVKENAAIADGFLAAPLEVMVRFGQWDAVLNEPEFPPLFPIARTLRHHARAVALAAQSKVAEAREEQKLFRASAATTPKEAQFGQNPAAKLFAVAEPVLEGELLYREGKTNEAVTLLKQAIAKEEELRYDEPPDWIIPARHSLGAILLQSGQHAEAEKVYREDLKQWPNNGWSLYGLMTCLKATGRLQEAAEVEKDFTTTWKNADVAITSSCKCVEK